mgnify:CR=1 FL=1
MNDSHHSTARFDGAPPEDLLPKTLADLRGVHRLPGVGHWTQQEAPEAVNKALIDWLATL